MLLFIGGHKQILKTWFKTCSHIFAHCIVPSQQLYKKLKFHSHHFAPLTNLTSPHASNFNMKNLSS
jgi:hypothetical protein